MWYNVLKIRRNAKRIEIVEAYKKNIYEKKKDSDIIFKRDVVFAKSEAFKFLRYRTIFNVFKFIFSFALLIYLFIFFSPFIVTYATKPVTLQSCLAGDDNRGLRIDKQSFIDGASKNGYTITNSSFESYKEFSAYKMIDDYKVELKVQGHRSTMYTCGLVIVNTEMIDNREEVSFYAVLEPNTNARNEIVLNNTIPGVKVEEWIYSRDESKPTFSFIPKSKKSNVLLNEDIVKVETDPYIKIILDEYANFFKK